MLKFGRNGAFMRDALRFAPRERLLDFLRTEGVEPVLTDDFYYFPASGKARDVADAFLRASNAEVRTDCEVTDIQVSDGKVAGVTLKTGDFLPADAVILAAGGCAWSGLGSSAGGSPSFSGTAGARRKRTKSSAWRRIVSIPFSAM